MYRHKELKIKKKTQQKMMNLIQIFLFKKKLQNNMVN